MKPGRILAVATATAAIAGCHGQPAASAVPETPAAATGAPINAGATEVLTRVSTEVFTPARGDSAIRAFIPEILPVDFGGECRLTRSRGSGATTVLAAFPRLDSSATSVTLLFDSAGHLVRFSDNRGGNQVIRPPPGATPAQRDSMVRLSIASQPRRTSINLDFATDQALAMNAGGGRRTEAVTGTVRQVESVQALGPPTMRIARIRKLCGV